MPDPVTHFEITGRDPAKLQKFYSDLFGWQIDASNPMNYGIIQPQDGKGIGGGIGGDPSGQDPGIVTFYVEVADPQATLDRAVSMGGKVLMPVTEVPGMVTFARFADPEGHVIGIVKAQ